jgi:hypothetical protein
VGSISGECGAKIERLVAETVSCGARKLQRIRPEILEEVAHAGCICGRYDPRNEINRQ